MRYKNLIIIGTSHIAPESLQEVKATLEKEQPKIVALELDPARLQGLMHKRGRIRLRDIRQIGVKGYIFGLIAAWAGKKLGEQVGVMPGSEMLAAVHIARKHKLQIALIDQDIAITLRRLSDSISWKEKWHFVVDLFKAIILRKREIEFDLKKVPSHQIIKKLMKKVKKRYPNIYKVLVVERNKVMARNLGTLLAMHREGKIVAVVGAGHEKDILDLVKKQKMPLYANEYTVAVE